MVAVLGGDGCKIVKIVVAALFFNLGFFFFFSDGFDEDEYRKQEKLCY